MTCIVGVVREGRAWIGGDSAGVNGHLSLMIRADTKVFTTGPFVMGFVGSFRMGQLLRYKLDIPKHPHWLADHEYMATLFIDAVRSCLKDGGYAEKHDDAEWGGTFLVGYRGHIYRVESDYQVGETTDGFDAIGCGGDIARGAVFAAQSGSDDGPLLVRAALQAAEWLSAGVRGPFEILPEPVDEAEAKAKPDG